MTHLKVPLVALLSLGLVSWAAAPTTTARSAMAQAQSTALERGYRTGYSDGYNAGFKDVSEHASRDYQSKPEYQQADRSYNEVWGPLDDYRDGYHQGFEAGYSAGYDQQPFNSSIPTGLRRREGSDAANIRTQPNNTPGNVSPGSTSSPGSTNTTSGSVFIPRDTILTIELQSGLSTDSSQRGDRFQARVLQPGEYQGSIVDGRVTEVKRPGKVKGVAELQISFDQIRLPDNRGNDFHAVVVEVVEMGGKDETGQVDREGGVKGKSSTKDDISRVGAATGIGAIIGAVFGGGKGAAIGAAVGGAVGTGSVLQKRGKDIHLPRGQQLRIRTSTDTRIQ